MKNPFSRSENNRRRIPEAGSRSYLRSKRLKIIAGVFTFIVLTVVISQSVTIIQAGHRGVVLFVGAVENRVLGEGVHLIIPFAEHVTPLEVRTLKYQADASAASKDLQEVATVIALNYHIDPSKANVVYQELGADYNNRIIAPTIQESIKASVAKFDAEKLITNRESAKATIADAISKTLSTRNIMVETLFITDFKFSEAFEKYLTEQNNLKTIQVVANQTVVQAQAQANANVAKASGEAQAITIITEQLKQRPQDLQWQSIT